MNALNVGLTDQFARTFRVSMDVFTKCGQNIIEFSVLMGSFLTFVGLIFNALVTRYLYYLQYPEQGFEYFQSFCNKFLLN